MTRSQKSELVQRINTAFLLLKKGLPNSKVILRLIKQFGISRIQAYRYIREALKSNQILPIPDQKKVFTVKLSERIISRVKDFAKSSGASISEIVEQALVDFVGKRKHGQRKYKT